MAATPTDSTNGNPPEDKDSNVAAQPPGTHTELVRFLGEEFLTDYLAGGGQLDDPILRQLYGIE